MLSLSVLVAVIIDWLAGEPKRGHPWWVLPPSLLWWFLLPNGAGATLGAIAAHAIETLPRLSAPGRVGILSPAYAEYAYRWQRQGHRAAAFTVAALNRCGVT